MNVWILVATNVVIGSVIGGVTNELAIRMLFRPYKPWRIGGFRVPFTPGLIPRRRDEIGVQMGRLVENHLLTVEGIKKALAHGNLEQTMRAWLTGYATQWMTSDRTLRSLLASMHPDLFADDGTWSDAVEQPVYEKYRSLAKRWLSQIEEKRVRDVIPVDVLIKWDETVDKLSEEILQRLRQYLHSEEGQKTLQGMLRGLLGGGGGMLGGLVGMFLGDDKLIGKLLPHLDEALQNPVLAAKLADFLHTETGRLLDKPMSEVLASIGDEQLEKWQKQLFVKLEEQSLRIIDMPISAWAERFVPTVADQLIPRVSAWVIQSLQQNVERIFGKLSISEIVARQVETFPLERVEEMIVGISGKEFRMITVLGFILGGFIGLVQGLILLLV